MTTMTAPAAVTIREATADDAMRLLWFLMDLAGRSPYVNGAPVNQPHLFKMLDTLLANPDAGFFVAEDGEAMVGLLVLLLFDDLMSAERRAAQVCWYVDPEYRNGLGAQLLAHGEAWAGDRGAARVEMLAPERKFETFYARRGYTPANRVYERRLPCRG